MAVTHKRLLINALQREMGKKSIGNDVLAPWHQAAH